MPEKEPIVYAYPRTRAFIQAAIAEGAHLKNPVRVGEDAWIRQRNMVGAYFASDATLEGLASVTGRITRERVRQIIKRGMANLWKMSPPDLQQKFPLDSIPLDKPVSLATRLAISRSLGGPLVKVVDGLQAGKSLEEIKQVSDLSGRQISNSRTKAKDFKVNVPYLRTPNQESRWRVEMLSRAQDRTFVRALLAGVGQSSAHHHSKGPNRCFVPISESIREAGYHVRNTDVSQFVKAVEEAGIPVISFVKKLKTGKRKDQILRYYFTTVPFQDEIKETFAKSEALDKFKEPKVRQIAGPKADQFPTTTDFVREKNYRTTAKLLKQLGIRIPTGYRYKMFIAGPDCPVPLFKGKRTSSICYPIDQDETLRRWIIDKVKSSFPSSLPS